MQRWEYMTWVVGNYGKGPVKERNGAEVPNWKHGPPLAAALNESGSEGWELIHTYANAFGEIVYVFRRPLLWDAES